MRGALVVATVLALGGVAGAQKGDARSHLVHGDQLYRDGQYAEAIDELKAGFAIEPLPDFLYALGQAERKRGDCRAAIAYYQRFLDTKPSSQRAVAALMQIDRCKEEMAAAPATTAPAPTAAPSPEPVAPATTAPAPTAAPVVSATAEKQPAASERRAYKKWWVWTIVGVAAAGVGVGLGVGLTQKSFSPTLPDLVIK